MHKQITINGVDLIPARTDVLEVVTYNQMMKSNMCTLVVDDSLVTGLKPINSFLNVYYNGDAKIIEKTIANKLKETYPTSGTQTYYMS
ncbi:MAG: hypothetical protein ACI35O_11340, partial [Bacillaceae bacterium]